MAGERALSDPSVQVLDPGFNKYRLGLAAERRAALHRRALERRPGLDGRRALPAVERHSEQPHPALGRGDRPHQHHRKPSNNGNGNTRDRQGRLITCEHDSRRITRTEYDGTITVLADKFDGKRLNSPERRGGEVRRLDLVHRSAVRHPRSLRGHDGDARSCRRNVYRLDTKSGQLTAVTPATSIGRTGLRSRPTSRSSMSSSATATPREIFRCIDVTDNGTKLAEQARRSSRPKPGGTPDGFRVDIDGNLWCGWGMGNAQQDGVKVFDPTGKPIGFIALPERCANVCVRRRRSAIACSWRRATRSIRCTSTRRA